MGPYLDANPNAPISGHSFAQNTGPLAPHFEQRLLLVQVSMAHNHVQSGLLWPHITSQILHATFLAEKRHSVRCVQCIYMQLRLALACIKCTCCSCAQVSGPQGHSWPPAASNCLWIWYSQYITELFGRPVVPLPGLLDWDLFLLGGNVRQCACSHSIVCCNVRQCACSHSTFRCMF